MPPDAKFSLGWALSPSKPTWVQGRGSEQHSTHRAMPNVCGQVTWAMRPSQSITGGQCGQRIPTTSSGVRIAQSEETPCP